MLKDGGRGWRGYVFSRPVGDGHTPHRVQNLVIRECARRHGLTYLLSATEYDLAGSFMMLKALLEELDTLDGAIFYSTHLLPGNAAFRRMIYAAFLERGKGLRFALEDLAVLDQADADRIEDLLMARALSAAPALDLLAAQKVRDKNFGAEFP